MVNSKMSARQYFQKPHNSLDFKIILLLLRWSLKLWFPLHTFSIITQKTYPCAWHMMYYPCSIQLLVSIFQMLFSQSPCSKINHANYAQLHCVSYYIHRLFQSAMFSKWKKKLFKFLCSTLMNKHYSSYPRPGYSSLINFHNIWIGRNQNSEKKRSISIDWWVLPILFNIT